ncbi:hypothetical protein [Gemmobacter lutimaris]|nr:hypothetical protein [Gemmobacter lutimaris]
MLHPDDDLSPKQRRAVARHWHRLQVTLPGMGAGRRISTRNPIKESAK